MPFNINEFINNTGVGFAREAHFEVQFSLPAIVQGNARQLSFLCNAANIPGRRIEKVNVRRYGMGFEQPFAIGTAYDALSLDFYCDGAADNLKILHKWMDSIFSFSTTDFQQVEYSSKYTTTLNLFQYDVTGKTIAEWIFYDAFPEGLPPINLNWNARNSVIIIPVAFGYSRYEQKTVDQGVKSVSGSTKPAQNNRLPETPAIKI